MVLYVHSKKEEEKEKRNEEGTERRNKGRNKMERRKEGRIKKSCAQSFSLSLVRRPPVSRPPHHRFCPGKAFLPLCHSEPGRPPRVKPRAYRGHRSPARHSRCSDCVSLSVNFIVWSRTNAPLGFSFAYQNDSYMVRTRYKCTTGASQGGQTEPVCASLVS